MDHESHDTRPPGFWRSRFGLGWLVLAGVAGWFLWQEHRAHLFGALPFLLLLACPLMHLFMHHGHHRHHGGGSRGDGSGSAGPGAAPGRREDSR